MAQKKIEKLIQKYNLDDSVKVYSDTVFILQTVEIPGDTLEKEVIKWQYDTLYRFEKGDLITEIVVKPETLYVKSEVLKRDTIIKQQTITNTKTKYITTPAKYPPLISFLLGNWKIWLILLIVGFIIGIVIKTLKNVT